MHLCVCMSYMLVDLNKSHKKKKHFKTDRQPKVIYLRVIIIEIIFRLRVNCTYSTKKKGVPTSTTPRYPSYQKLFGDINDTIFFHYNLQYLMRL